MKHKLIIGLLFASQYLFAGTNGAETLNNSFSTIAMVLVIVLIVFAVHNSLKAYEAIVESMEKEINEK